MDITVTPGTFCGNVEAISSKSFAHRIIMAAALSNKPTKINLNTYSEDINATLNCITALGATVNKYDEYIEVFPINFDKKSDVVLDCGESGSTARFILPIASVICDNFEILGHGRLPERPFSPLVSQMCQHGVYTSSENLPMKVSGKLYGGRYEIAGNISSQYITGLMLALPLCDTESEIVLTSPLESGAYVDITIEVLSNFGIKIIKTPNGFRVMPGKYISCGEMTVEGDWSNAAFWIAADKICKNVNVFGLNEHSLQGDKAIMTVAGADVIDAKEIPDLVPILSVLACAKKGTTRIINAERLRLKESDRLKAVSESLSALGADICETADGLIINGNGKLRGGVCDGFGDHRIVMSAAIASCICDECVTIKGAQAVNKSYPTFFEDFNRLKQSERK